MNYVHDAYLTTTELEVICRNETSHDDNQGSRFGIHVEAAHFPEREKIVQRMAETIAFEVKSILDAYLKFYVWVTLTHAGYAEVVPGA